MDKVMNYILDNRLVYPKAEVGYKSQYEGYLLGLSFDSSVCSDFDELSLYSEYYQSILKLRFKCTSSTK